MAFKFWFQAFIVLACIVAAISADGPSGHGHAHAHGPQVRVVPALHRAVPVVQAIPIVHSAPSPVLVQAEPAYVPAPAPSYAPAPAPAFRPAPVYGEPEPISPPAYDFGYGVQGDAYTGSAQYAHNENRNGYNTAGEYRVALPDGRTQIVSYRVDDAESGYVADVRYEGVAIPYEAPKPAYAPAPAPAYAPIA